MIHSIVSFFFLGARFRCNNPQAGVYVKCFRKNSAGNDSWVTLHNFINNNCNSCVFCLLTLHLGKNDCYRLSAEIWNDKAAVICSCRLNLIHIVIIRFSVLGCYTSNWTASQRVHKYHYLTTHTASAVHTFCVCCLSCTSRFACICKHSENVSLLVLFQVELLRRKSAADASACCTCFNPMVALTVYLRATIILLAPGMGGGGGRLFVQFRMRIGRRRGFCK